MTQIINDFSNHPISGIGAASARGADPVPAMCGTYAATILKITGITQKTPPNVGNILFIIEYKIDDVLRGHGPNGDHDYTDALGAEKTANVPGDTGKVWLHEKFGASTKKAQKELLISVDQRVYSDQWVEHYPDGAPEEVWTELFCRACYDGFQPPPGCDRMDLSTWGAQPYQGCAITLQITDKLNKQGRENIEDPEAKVWPNYLFLRSDN